MKLNINYETLEKNYLFAEVENRTSLYKAAHPETQLMRLGIGDVTLPIFPAAVAAIKAGAEELSKAESFKGYGPYAGYGFLLTAIQTYYQEKGVALDTGEIFVSDGAKGDVSNILDLFALDNVVAIPDPVYPVYADTNLMLGRKPVYIDANEENGFLPLPDEKLAADIIYICSPNNPTGAVYTKEALKKWVDYANERGAVIFYDAAYEAFISDPALPSSIYQIEGAKTCAIEMCSFSKTAGFTGVRCGYMVVPFALAAGKLNKAWLRRQSTKSNGVSYVVQKGAAAVFSPEGRAQARENIAYYKENARVMGESLSSAGYSFYGGLHSPYIWMRCPRSLSSWDYFDLLLEQANVVGTPGSGFGKNGQGYFRLTAFGGRDATKEAMRRLISL